MKKIAKEIVIILVLVIAGAYVIISRRADRTPSSAIVVSGNIELTEVNVAFKTPGKLIERTVDEGEVVKKGQVIARLDRDQLMAQRGREAAGLNSALSQLAQAETSLAWQKENLAADLEHRRIWQQQAHCELKMAHDRRKSRSQAAVNRASGV
jgi:HlyD family secretion protein